MQQEANATIETNSSVALNHHRNLTCSVKGYTSLAFSELITKLFCLHTDWAYDHKVHKNTIAVGC